MHLVKITIICALTMLFTVSTQPIHEGLSPHHPRSHIIHAQITKPKIENKQKTKLLPVYTPGKLGNHP